MEVLITARIAGCICIGAASFFVGAELERKLKQQWQIMREGKELLEFLEKEMTYRRNPVDIALKEAAGNCHTCMREFLLAVSEEVTLRQGAEFGTLWKEQLVDAMPVDQLAQEQYQALCEAASALCTADTVMQRQRLETYIARFEQLSEQARQHYVEKSRLYRRLSAAAGAFLMILFI